MSDYMTGAREGTKLGARSDSEAGAKAETEARSGIEVGLGSETINEMKLLYQATE